MKIGAILRSQQEDIYHQLNKEQNKKKQRSEKKEHLSFREIQNLMKHSSYKRHKGALREIR